MHKPSMLIVEDEAIVAEDLSCKVKALGYEVVGIAPTGEEALQVARKFYPELVLLDLQLAGNLNGIQTAEHLREFWDGAIVFVTANSDPTTVKNANITSPLGYILKPFGERDLAVQLEIAIHKHRASKALRENQERLKQANAYLDLAQKAGSVGFFDYYFDQDVSVWTEGLAELFGISLGEFEGSWDGWAKRVVPQDVQHVRQVMLATVNERHEHVSYEFRAILPDRRVRWLASRGRIFYGPDGKPVRMTGVNSDISERKHSEQQLQKSEAILLRAQRGASAGVWEIDLRNGSFTWSEPYYDLFGLDHSLRPSLDVWLSCIHPEDRARIAAEHELSVKEARDQSMEFRIVKPDGPVRWIHRKGQAEFDEQGCAVRINGISFDITERKVAEEAVKAIALFPAQNPSPVLRVSVAGILLYMNPASEQVLRDLNLVIGQSVPLDLQEGVQQSLQAAQCETRERFMNSRYYLITVAPVSQGGYANLYWTDITEQKSSEEALRASEERWHLAVTGSTDGLWDWDIIGRRVFLSARWKELRGYQDEEIGSAETEWSSRIHPDDYQTVITTVQAYLYKTTPSYQCEYRTRCKDGTYRWVVDRGIAVWDDHGRAVRMVGSETDITGRKLAEAALREREAELQIVVQRTPFLLTRCNRELRYEFVSRAYADMLGRRPDDIAGKPIADIIGKHGFQTILPHIQQVLNGSPVEYETDVQFASIGMRSLHVHYTPDKDEQGNVRGWIASIVDITERKRAREALRESEARFRVMADTAPVLVWMSDVTKLCSWFNKPWLDFTGRTIEQELGNGWAELVHPDDFERCLETYTSSFEARQPFKMEYRLRRHDGEYRWLLDHGVPRYAEGGEFLGYIGSCIDVTERRDSEERMRESAQHLEHLVEERTRDLAQSHDRLRALAAELNLAEQRERQRIATELHDHLQQLLALAKLKIGQGKRVAKTVPACEHLIQDTDEILSEALEYTRTLVAELSPPVLRDHGLPAALKWIGEHMKKHDLTVTVTVPKHLELRLPKDQALLLYQSVRELLFNTSKHAGTHEAWVAMEEREGRLIIDVTDKGAGFSHSPEEATGSKFGLLSIRERMRALGGTFTIGSATGQGTIVTLVLPLAVCQSSVETHEADEIPKHGVPSLEASLNSEDKIRIVLVDDHTIVRQGLRSLLEGYPDLEIVAEATNGAEAVRATRELRPQVIVMDINMPGMNGIEATTRIKADCPGTIIIGLSVNADGENQIAMQRAGASILLTKEDAVEHLYAEIRNALRENEPLIPSSATTSQKLS
jgi:PAS domain S-box-containing protein